MASALLPIMWPRGNGRLGLLRRPGPLIGKRDTRSLRKDTPGESSSGTPPTTSDDGKRRVRQLWAGIDAGKTHHHCVVIGEDGKRLYSRRILNDEAELTQMVADVTALGEVEAWAVDLNAGGAALLITLLLKAGQPLLYIPGRVVHRAAGMYRGEGKTDARDAAVIADQARVRRDLRPMMQRDTVARDLHVLTARRADVGADHTREVNRLRAQLVEYFPALERALDVTESKSALILLSGFATPSALREISSQDLVAWLKEHGVRAPAGLVMKAKAAAEAQPTTVDGEPAAARMVARIVASVQALRVELAELDAEIEERLQAHPQAAVVLSLPGMGTVLASEFLAATGGDVTVFETADRLAAVSGLAPAPRDSGRISGNLRRPQRYSRRLLRVAYLSAQVSIRYSPDSRAYYQRKRAEGKRHTQAVLALARRRVNVLWAMLRDGRCFAPTPPAQPTPPAPTTAIPTPPATAAA
jgi:transposase